MKMHASHITKVGLAVSLAFLCGRLNAGEPVSEPKQIEVDKNMCVGGVPIFTPSFRMEGSNVVVSGGDFRNTVLDFRKADVEALALAQVFSDLGCFGTVSEKHFTIGLLLDDKDRRMFFDQNWTYYPGNIRKIQTGGPFATVHIQCLRERKEVGGVEVEVGGTRGQTGTNGWASLELKGIQKPILPIKIVDPKGGKPIESRIAVPIASARPGLVHYKTITVELPER